MKTYHRAHAADFKNIPAALKACAQWECWKILTDEKGKKRKVPVNPLTGRTYPTGLNSENMGNATYEQAVRCFARNPSLCGIGFRFKKSDPFSGVDMDDCCNPAEHSTQSWAIDVVEKFQTYSEYSPSGTGIKLIAIGKIPAAVTKTNNVEMYSDGRFFALTGRGVNGVTVIRSAQQELDRLYNVLTVEKKPHADSPTPSAANSTPGTKWKPEGEHYKKLLSVIGSLHRHDPSMSEAQGVSAATAVDRERAEEPYPEEKIRGMVRDIWKKIDPPAPPAVEVQEVVEAAEKCEVLPYPLAAWKGTLYGEWAERMTADNHIPREFFIEALKTCVGSAVGDRVSLNRDGGNLRQYTVLIGVVGKGRGTATRSTIEFLRKSDYLQHENDSLAHIFTGAIQANAGSEVGLYNAAAKCSRVLLCPSEFGEFLAKLHIENSALPSVLLELYDSTWLTPSTTAKRKSQTMPTRCLLSLLATTQRRSWDSALAMHGGLGSGQLSRLTLVCNEETRTVSSLSLPDLKDWPLRMQRKLETLETLPVNITVSTDADKLLRAWWGDIKALPDEDEEVITRLNVITLRNALHLAWISDAQEISVEHMARAITLGEYQLSQRRDLIVTAADNAFACHQQKILACLRRHGPSTARQIYNRTHAYRVGTQLHNAALNGLVTDGQVFPRPTTHVNSTVFHLPKSQGESA